MLDAATVILLGTATVILAQPESLLRVKWSRYRAEAATRASARLTWARISATSSRMYSEDADVDVVEIADYECPFCRLSSAAVDSSVSDGVRVAYLHLPRDERPMSVKAATAALCAERLGRFREMHQRLMNSAEWRSDTVWTREAATIGMDSSRFARCLMDRDVAERLAAHRTLAENLKVVGTPTFVSGSRIHSGVITRSELRRFGHAR